MGRGIAVLAVSTGESFAGGKGYNCACSKYRRVACRWVGGAVHLQ